MIKYIIKFTNQTSIEVDEEHLPAILNVYSAEIKEIESNLFIHY